MWLLGCYVQMTRHKRKCASKNEGSRATGKGLREWATGDIKRIKNGKEIV